MIFGQKVLTVTGSVAGGTDMLLVAIDQSCVVFLSNQDRSHDDYQAQFLKVFLQL